MVWTRKFFFLSNLIKGADRIDSFWFAEVNQKSKKILIRGVDFLWFILIHFRSKQIALIHFDSEFILNCKSSWSELFNFKIWTWFLISFRALFKHYYHQFWAFWWILKYSHPFGCRLQLTLSDFFWFRTFFTKVSRTSLSPGLLKCLVISMWFFLEIRWIGVRIWWGFATT